MKCVVFGKRWFDKVNGNTYHSCEVFVDNQSIGYIPFTYGYENQYQQTAMDILSQYDSKYKAIEQESPWRYFDRLFGPGETLFLVADVGRKKDL